MFVLANNFLAGSLISLLIPTVVFIVIVIWYTYSVRRMAGARGEVPEPPGPRQPPSAGLKPQSEPPGPST